MASGRKVMVVGSGGREHALALKLLESPSVLEVLVLPGNAGTAEAPPRLPDKRLGNVAGEPLELARREQVDLVVVGPEAPLCAGLVDELVAAGITAYGPSRAAARLEGSKAFMKAFAERAGIPTARHVVVRDERELERGLSDFAEAPVVKADGLCAGKGVVVPETHAEAREAARAMLSGERFGAAGQVIVLEQRIRAQEASLHAICDGERALILPAAQDHKRIGDGDTGPNTGGMGTYAPAPLVTPALLDRAEREIFTPALASMAREGTPFRGTLFAGLMIGDDDSLSLLEFNVRFGDPETQVLMSVLDGDLGEALLGAARGRLDPKSIALSADHALCVVLASAGYPESARSGDPIAGLPAASELPGVELYHAGTRREQGQVVTAGGRVLGVTARARSLAEARNRAYHAVDLIEFAGKQFRRDIGHRALGAR